ncbi:MAG TPA: glycosyltransferase family 9 protein [bacterium]|nr:glycosyltransferase family 9 protein [bacterium]
MKILAVKTHAMGDVLMTTPAIRALKHRFPDSVIHYLTGQWSAPALENNPHIDTVISVPDSMFHQKRFLRLAKLIMQLRAERYDACALFQPARMMRVFAGLTGARRIVSPGPDGSDQSGSTVSQWRACRDRYVAEDFMDVVRLLGTSTGDLRLEYCVTRDAMERVDRLLLNRHAQSDDFLLVCPGGGRNPRDFVRQKLWPLDRFAQVIEFAISDGIPVIMAGGRSDGEYLASLGDGTGVVNLAGKTSLAELAALLTRARMLLTNDSAPMHLALAVGCPFVAIFGPTRRAALLPASGRFMTVEAAFPCAPCYDNEPFKACERMDCIQSIDVDTVWKAVCDGWKRWRGQDLEND